VLSRQTCTYYVILVVNGPESVKETVGKSKEFVQVIQFRRREIILSDMIIIFKIGRN
jgi:hypothetical protein